MERKILLEQVKKELRPKKLHLVAVDSIISALNRSLKKKGIVAEAVQGGSTAKGTFLKHDHDVDIFVRFEKKYADEDLADLLEETIPWKAKRIHGSRDYFQFVKYKLQFEVVPVLKVTKAADARNVTDVSPLHVDWVLKKFKKKDLRDDIRLAKQFCKSAKVYGAESYIQGFSGHILDILVLQYGGFIPLLEAAVQWKPKVVLDPEQQLKQPMMELNDAKLQSPLIIIDPVQPGRNAAAALSLEKFDIFVEKAKQFLKQPDHSFFEIVHLQPSMLKERKDSSLYILNVQSLPGKDDVVGSKLLKSFTYIKKQLEKNKFTVVESDWIFDKKSFFYFYIVEKQLSATFIQEGPPATAKKHVVSFKKKHPKAFLKDKRWYAKVKRQYRTPPALFEALVSGEYVKEKVKSIRKK